MVYYKELEFESNITFNPVCYEDNEPGSVQCKLVNENVIYSHV